MLYLLSCASIASNIFAIKVRVFCLRILCCWPCPQPKTVPSPASLLSAVPRGDAHVRSSIASCGSEKKTRPCPGRRTSVVRFWPPETRPSPPPPWLRATLPGDTAEGSRRLPRRRFQSGPSRPSFATPLGGLAVAPTSGAGLPRLVSASPATASVPILQSGQFMEE